MLVIGSISLPPNPTSSPTRLWRRVRVAFGANLDRVCNVSKSNPAGGSCNRWAAIRNHKLSRVIRTKMDRNYQYSLLIITRIWFKDGKEMVRAPKSALQYGENKESMSLPKYRIDKTPVTNSDFARFVQATGYKTIAKKTRNCIA